MNKAEEIREKILPKQYWEEAYSCEKCKYKLRKNIDQVYQHKKNALDEIRQKIRRERNIQKPSMYEGVFELDRSWDDLNEEGVFTDRDSQNYLQDLQSLVILAEEYREKKQLTEEEIIKRKKIYRGIIYYGNQEVGRTDLGATRFHGSIFAIPFASVDLFNIFYEDMRAIEKSENKDSLAIAVYEVLLKLALQAWTLPLKGDHTDTHPISPERFRDHTWWVGGNALSYRPIFQTAAMLMSVEMMDTVCYIMKSMCSETSANEEEESFWSEGICADGFGWGHGRQAYNEGYPVDSIRDCIKFIGELKDTPWEEEIREINLEYILKFLRGSSWSHYRGAYAPMQSRMIFSYKGELKIPCLVGELAESLVKNGSYLLSDNEVKELNQLAKEALDVTMEDYPEGTYTGIRYFWNNDDLIKKVSEHYIYINMASSRCDGVECAASMADTMNFFAADGSYVMIKEGDEYTETMGAWQVSALPGITARKLTIEEITPEDNWRGYNSMHNFAGGIGKGKTGVCGFIYLKNREKQGRAIGQEQPEQFNEALFDVEAYKSYFIIKDTLWCLGAGITDKNPQINKPIYTTLNQTKWEDNAQVPVEVESQKGISYISHKGILYGIDESGTTGSICVNCEERKPRWTELNLKNKLPARSKNKQRFLEWVGEGVGYLNKLNLYRSSIPSKVVNVLDIGINHGVGVIDGKYSYWMYLGNRSKEQYIEEEHLKVLHNTTEIQAIANTNEKIIQAIFFSAKAQCECDKWKITVSHPVVLMLEEEETKYSLTLCDPTQNVQVKEIQVRIENKEGKKMCIKCMMPMAHQLGRQITMDWNKEIK